LTDHTGRWRRRWAGASKSSDGTSDRTRAGDLRTGIAMARLPRSLRSHPRRRRPSAPATAIIGCHERLCSYRRAHRRGTVGDRRRSGALGGGRLSRHRRLPAGNHRLGRRPGRRRRCPVGGPAAPVAAWPGGVACPDPRATAAVPVRASANLALAHSPQPDPRIGQQLHDPLDVPAEPVVITAGIALAYRLGGHLPDQARPILVDASTPDRLPAVAGWDRALRGFVMLALQRLTSS
jgi:hypothetical protein